MSDFRSLEQILQPRLESGLTVSEHPRVTSKDHWIISKLQGTTSEHREAISDDHITILMYRRITSDDRWFISMQSRTTSYSHGNTFARHRIITDNCYNYLEHQGTLLDGLGATLGHRGSISKNCKTTSDDSKTILGTAEPLRMTNVVF